jgi:hypothetical protein
MTRPAGEDARAPSPEQLAAFADGELDAGPLAPLKPYVEEWLRDHPEARAEVEAQHRLADLWRATTPPDPGEAAWAALFARLPDALPLDTEAGRRRWRWLAWVAGTVATTAAAVGLALYLLRPAADDGRAGHDVRPPVQAAPGADDDLTPFPVATADEVQILRVDGADTGTLVVGELPVRGALVLVGPGDVTITSVQPAADDNMVPQVRLEGARTPVVWAPLEGENASNDERK